MEERELEWWGYVHINGTTHLKRYWGTVDVLRDAVESDFVLKVIDVFSASTREEAVKIFNSKCYKIMKQ